MVASVDDAVGLRLDIARKELLDLGLRNTLLNYRPLRTRGVEVVDEVPAEVFRILVRERRSMTFVPAPDKDDAGPLSQPDEGGAPGSPAARHTDPRLQTLVSSSQLQARLLATYYAAHTFIEEQGVNILFLALGMLNWYEADSSQTRLRAPLVLIPVGLERSNARDRFHLRYTEEDIGGNLSLAAKLKAEFAITFPELPDVEDLDVEQYFDTVERALQSQPRWSVDRRAVVLGFFSFGKFLMYRDLDAATWPEHQKLTGHPMLRALLQDGFREPASPIGDTDQLDRHIVPANTYQVVDADSSQTLAILDVNRQRNLVIQGPPGTGKSQTITNLIAEAIGNGKTVLFVAEKMAALEVVKRRLDHVGLGDACLELHSFKTQKKAVLSELARTLELGKPQPVRGASELAVLPDVRDALNAYYQALSTPIANSEVTPYQALGELSQLRRTYREGTLPRLDLPSVLTWSAADFIRRQMLIEALQSRLQLIGVPKNHPFWGSQRKTLLPMEQDRLRDVIRAAERATSEVQAAATALAQSLGQPEPKNHSELNPLLRSWWLRWRFLFSNDRRIRQTVLAAVQQHQDKVHEVVTLLELDQAVRFGPDANLAELDFAAQIEIFKTWAQSINNLQGLVAYNDLAEDVRKEQLEPILSVIESWSAASSCLEPAFRYSWYERLLETAFHERPALARFDAHAHENQMRKFQELDRLTFDYNRARLADAHWTKLPLQNGSDRGQLGVLRREFEKKARHLPIRQLMARAGNAIQAIKPVFMMSPLSIATFLPPASLRFDLVIFDEASQVRPVDAFGAIARGRQVVVVGDSRQLPPTSFFDSLTRGDELDEDSLTADIESILGLLVAQGAPQRMLRWHYRSRHESLITVSNHEFYDNRLVVFPSSHAERGAMGLLYHHLANTSYDRGRSRTNLREAGVVAQAVMKHARTQPQLMLGVVAFSVAQMQAIQDQLEILRRQDPSCEAFFTAHPFEPFFVKNLENVQGDERDVIFISIGYGRTADGYLAMDFGPLNRDGGERRLNVLITRARLRCEVFTNLTADDIDLERTQARGVRALKTFLSYAQKGILDVPVPTGRAADSPFEEAVYSALEAAGYHVQKQVGSGGFFIDLAIVDPNRPGRYLLGIECDGATYHSSRSARDRDRLRQHVLEGLGWRIHRIWSTDWFRSPEREWQRLVAAIDEARRAAAAQSVSTSVHYSQNTVIQRERNTAPAQGVNNVPAYQVASLTIGPGRRELHRVPTATLAAWVIDVVWVESPVHIDEVTRRIADAVGVKRIGSRIQESIEAACEHAVRARKIRRQGSFLWLPDMNQPPVRDRSALPAAARRLELIAPEEIAAAVEKVVVDAYGLELEHIPAAAGRLLGFARMTDDMRRQIEPILHSMIKQGRLVQQGNHIVVQTS